jgi:hypothetical protein
VAAEVEVEQLFLELFVVLLFRFGLRLFVDFFVLVERQRIGKQQ